MEIESILIPGYEYSKEQRRDLAEHFYGLYDAYMDASRKNRGTFRESRYKKMAEHYFELYRQYDDGE